MCFDYDFSIFYKNIEYNNTNLFSYIVEVLSMLWTSLHYNQYASRVVLLLDASRIVCFFVFDAF